MRNLCTKEEIVNVEVVQFKNFKERIRHVKYIDENIKGVMVNIIDERTIMIIDKEYIA